jgi:hypothetical protein
MQNSMGMLCNTSPLTELQAFWKSANNLRANCSISSDSLIRIAVSYVFLESLQLVIRGRGSDGIFFSSPLHPDRFWVPTSLLSSGWLGALTQGV